MRYQKVDYQIVFLLRDEVKTNGRLMFVLTLHTMSIFQDICPLKTQIIGIQQQLIMQSVTK